MKNRAKGQFILIGFLFAIVVCCLVLTSAPVEGAIRSASSLMPYGSDTPAQLFERGRNFQTDEKLDSALICYSWLVERYRDDNDPAVRSIVGGSLSEMGQIYYVRYNNYTRAFRCLTEAEQIFKNNADRAAYAKVLLNLGNLFNIYEYIFPASKDESFSRSKDYYRNTLDIALKEKDWSMVCAAYINMAMLDLPFGVDEALNRRMKTLLLDSIPPSTPDYRLSLELCTGSESIIMGDYASARAAMTAMRDSIGLKAPRDKYMASVCLSAVSLAEGKYSEAIEEISDILTDRNTINDADVHMEIYDYLSRYYAAAGDMTMSKSYRIDFYEAKDSLMRQIVTLEPTRLGIELEQVRENARTLEEDKARIRLWLLFSVVILLAIGVFMVILFRKNRQLKLKNKVIFNQTQSLIHVSGGAGETAGVDSEMKVEENAEIKRGMYESLTSEKDGPQVRPEKYRVSSLTDETRKELIVKIARVMEDTKEICDSNFSLQRLTSIVGSNTSYISRIVNEHYGMSFANLLNRCRIQEACRRMGDTANYGNLTIEAISEGVGFNTRSTFTKAFRLNIGMLPSEYAKLLKSRP